MTSTATGDIEALLRRLQRSVDSISRAGRFAAMTTLGSIDGLPLQQLSLGATTGRRLLLIAGTHGDEPASVEAALQLLESFPASWLEQLGIDMLPCTNPTGWQRGTRENAQGIDINWAFARQDVAEVEILKGFLAGRTWDVVVDFHEDWEATGFYLYEHQRQRDFIGPRVVKRVATVCPAETATDIDGWPAEGAVVHADDSVERLQRGDGLPLILLRDHTDHKLTTETPTCLPLQQRVAAHHAALAAIVEHHLEKRG